MPSKSDKEAQARQVKAEIDRLDAQAELAGDRYQEAKARHAALASEMDKLQARMAKQRKQIGYLEGRLNVRAKQMYRTGPVGIVEVLLEAKDFEEFTTNWDLLRSISRTDVRLVAELEYARASAKKTYGELAKREKSAAEQKAIMAREYAAANRALAERKDKLRGIEAEIARIEAVEAAAARRAAAAARAAAAVRASVSSTSRSFPPPTRAPRSEVVNIAMRYLGAPYVWGASGPNAFDCSGFTMFVYRQVGVSLPHSSRAQIGCGERVSRADLQPGDLVFFGSPIHHVGIYVGGGSYIHAPHSGDVVKISPLDRGDYAGACRP